MLTIEPALFAGTTVQLAGNGQPEELAALEAPELDALEADLNSMRLKLI